MSDWYPFPSLPRTVCRTMDPRHLNSVANHADVRLRLGGEGPIDLTPVITNPEHLAFETEHGGILALALGSGRYDIHTLFLPGGRGTEAAEAMRDVSDIMFSATDCTEGRTTVPVDNGPARVAARRAGFVPLFQMPVAWGGGHQLEADFLSLSMDRWALESPTTSILGAWFHNSLAAAKAAAGVTTPAHPESAIHNKYVGAACLMLHAGNAEKAVRFYNVWAGAAGYGVITLLRGRPIVLDIGDAIVEARPNALEVLVCR